MKISTILLPAVVLTLAGTQVQAQTPMFNSATGTSNSTFLLGNTSYSKKAQLLFTPGDLPGATAGNINRLYFMYGSTGTSNGNTYTNFTIKLGQTTATAFTPAGATTYNFFTGLSTVLDSASYTVAPGTAGTWFAIDLDSMFTFDPAQSLVMEVSFDNSSTQNFGTYGPTVPSGTVKKVFTPDRTSATGGASSSTLQSMGIDVGTVTIRPAFAPQLAATVYPNPAGPFCLVRLEKAEAATVTVFDLSGRQLQQQHYPATGADLRLPTGHLPTGLYQVRISTASGVTSLPLTVRP